MINIEEELINRINKAKTEVQEKLFKRFIAESETENRHEIYAEATGLNSVCFALVKAIRSESTDAR